MWEYNIFKRADLKVFLFMFWYKIQKVQFSSVMSDSLPPHEPQHARPPCPSPIPGVYSNSCPLSRWCHPTISSSVVPLSSRLQFFLASRSFPVSQLFVSVGQSIGFSFSISPSNEYSGLISFRMDWVDLLASSSVQSLSRVWLFVTPWTAACQASLPPITNSQSLLKLMSIESVMPSNHVILCRPLLFLPSIFPSIGVFSNESALCIRWPKYWTFSFNISLSNEYSGLISFRMDWLDLLTV